MGNLPVAFMLGGRAVDNKGQLELEYTLPILNHPGDDIHNEAPLR